MKTRPTNPTDVSKAMKNIEKEDLPKSTPKKPFKFSEAYREAHAYKTRQLALLTAATHLPGITNDEKLLGVIALFAKDTSKAELDFEELRRNEDA